MSVWKDLIGLDFEMWYAFECIAPAHHRWYVKMQ